MARDPLIKDEQYPPVRVRREMLELTQEAASERRLRLTEYIRQAVEERVRRDIRQKTTRPK